MLASQVSLTARVARVDTGPRWREGDRVVAIEDTQFPGPWPGRPSGTVVGEPTLVTTMSGPELSYWIRFDVPQRDLDGDGPYDRSQLLERHLEAE